MVSLTFLRNHSLNATTKFNPKAENETNTEQGPGLPGLFRLNTLSTDGRHRPWAYMDEDREKRFRTPRETRDRRTRKRTKLGCNIAGCCEEFTDIYGGSPVIIRCHELEHCERFSNLEMMVVDTSAELREGGCPEYVACQFLCSFTGNSFQATDVFFPRRPRPAFGEGLCHSLRSHDCVGRPTGLPGRTCSWVRTKTYTSLATGVFLAGSVETG